MRTLQSQERLRAGNQRGWRFSFSSRVVPAIVVALDAVGILAAAIASYAIFVGSYYDDLTFYVAATCFVCLTTILLMQMAGLYEFEPILRPLTFADKIIIASGTTFLLLLAAAFSLKVSSVFSRYWVVGFAGGASGITFVYRVLASRLVRYLAQQRVFTRNVVIAGTREQIQCLLAQIVAAPPRFVTLVGVFIDDPWHSSEHQRLGRLEDVADFARNNAIDDIVLALPWSADERIMGLMAGLRELPVNVYLSSDLIGFRLPFRPPPDHFGEMPLVEVMGRPLAGWGGVQKAALDYGIGVILIVLFMPLMLMVAIAIKLESRGSIFFRQERLGFVNQVFSIRKFRTMHEGIGLSARTIQAKRNDPRVTKVGRFLRRTSLDELPQLFNVLTGTMSLVGPRPLAIDHNEEYSRVILGYFARHRVKPGITGWAQVSGLRGETTTVDEMDARVKHDIYYVENWTPWFDLKILLMTIVATLSGRNAY